MIFKKNYDFISDLKECGIFVSANDVVKAKRSLDNSSIYFLTKHVLKKESFSIQKFTPKSGKLEILVEEIDLTDGMENFSNLVHAGI